MKLSRRFLIHVAVSTFLVVAVATTVTYMMVFNALKQRELRQLDIYVGERAQREEARFLQVESNLLLVRGQFLKRMEAPIDRAVLDQKWNHWYRHYDDGAWRTREEFDDARKYSSLWTHRDWMDTAETRKQIIVAQELCDELIPGWVDSFPSIFFQFHGPATIGFDARLPTWVWEMPADYDGTGFEWIELSLPKEDPPEGFYWTGVQQDSVVANPLVSVFVPIYEDGKFLGSVGHDIFMGGMLEEATRSFIPGASHFIFRTDGRLVAHPSRRDDIFKSRGLLKVQDCGDPALANLYRIAKSSSERRFSGFDPESGIYYSFARLVGPEWFYVTIMPREYIQKQAFASAKGVLWSGMLSLAFVIISTGLILRTQVSRPLAGLINATKAISMGVTAPPVDFAQRSDELGILASSFLDMNAKVVARENELRQLNTNLEQRVTERTEELAHANRRLEEALQTEQEVSELRANFVSLVSHEFRTPLEIILTSSDILARYLDRLPEEKRIHHLRTIHDAVKRMSGMMEDVLLLGRVEAGKLQFKPQPLNLPQLCRRIIDETISVTGARCPLDVQIEGELAGACGDESLLSHVFANLLSNAVKYSPPGAPVTVRLRRDGGDAVLSISDRGRGIPRSDRERLFHSFHRGSNVSDTPGTGLGLLIVRKCVQIHDGAISLESEEDRGTTFTVTLPLFSRTEAEYVI